MKVGCAPFISGRIKTLIYNRKPVHFANVTLHPFINGSLSNKMTFMPL